MATLQFPRKGVAILESGNISNPRLIDVVVDLGKDVTMVSATDDIVIADLPAGTVVLAAGIEQLVASAAGSTLAARVGSTAVSGTLASDAAVGTITGATAANVPAVVPLAGATLNILNASAERNTGSVRVWAIVSEGTRSPKRATAAVRDQSNQTS